MRVPGQLIRIFLTFFCPHRGRISCSVSALTRIVFPVLALPLREHGACRHSHCPEIGLQYTHSQPSQPAHSQPSACTHTSALSTQQLQPRRGSQSSREQQKGHEPMIMSWGGMGCDVPSAGGQAPALEASCTRVRSCRVFEGLGRF